MYRALYPRLLGVLLLLLLPSALFPGALPGPRVVAADDHLGVHHVQRTAQGPTGSVYNPQLSDPAVQFRPLQDRIRASWAQGRAPLWNPDIFAGVPLLADGLSAACYPPVLFELVLPEGTAQDLRVWMHLALAGLGTALLAWWLGATPAGGLLAGLAAMLAGWPVSRLLHPHAWVYAWVPWLTWSLVRLGRGRGPIPVALAFCAMLLAGHPQTAVHGLLFALGVAAFTLRGQRAWAWVLLGLVLGALLAAPAILPFAAELARSETVHARSGNHLPWRALLTLAWPDPFGHPARGTWRGPGAHLEENLHVGLVVLGLALWGLRARLGRLWVAGAALALAVAVGLPLLDWIPANHARLGGMATLCLALAAGLALPRRRWAWVLCFLAAGELLWARRDDQGTLASEQYRAPLAPWTRQLAGADLGARVSGLGWAIQPDTGMLAGLSDVRGYDLPVSRDTERLMAALEPALQRPWYPISALTERNLPLLRFLGVRFLAVVAGDERAEASVAGLREITTWDAPLRIFYVGNGLSTGWLAYGARRVGSAEEALDSIAQGDDAQRIPPVVLEGEPDPVLGAVLACGDPPEPGDMFLGGQWPPERLHFEVTAAQPALAVWTDAWAPGWEATVDGSPAPLVKVAGLFKGVAVSAGFHRVEFRYRPSGWRWGLRLALLGTLGLLATALASGVSRTVEKRRTGFDTSTPS
jgi:hypothetical protein